LRRVLQEKRSGPKRKGDGGEGFPLQWKHTFFERLKRGRGTEKSAVGAERDMKWEKRGKRPTSR